MPEFKVTISDMNEAATNMKTQSENFRTASAAMLQAAQSLTETGWRDEAADVFQTKIAEMDNWVKSMSEIIDEYSSNLNTSADLYQEADETAAKNFKH